MISIGIPTYNQADTLCTTIESFLNQSVKPLEIVVSENWCTDHTQEVLKEFEGKIKVVRPERHLSMMENWNFLVSQLQGDWFSLMSSDDLALPNFVSDISRAITENSGAVLIRGPYEAIDSDGVVLNRRTSKYAARSRIFPGNFYEQIQNTKTSFAAFCLNRSTFNKLGGFDENLKLAGDWAMWLKLSAYGSFITLPDIISQYRVDYRSGMTEARMLFEVDDHLYINERIIPSINRNFITKLIQAYSCHNKFLSVKSRDSIDLDLPLSDRYRRLEKLSSSRLDRTLGYLLSKIYRIRTIK